MSDATPYIGDFYDTLGVERTATQDEIKKAFRKLARSHHPDVAGDDPNAAERFDRIRKAYDVLGDPEERAKYDRGPVRRPRGGGRWTDQGYRMPGGMYARSQPGPRTRTPRGRGSRRRDPANDMSLDDLFGDFGFGGEPKQKSRRSTGGPSSGGGGASGSGGGRSGMGIDIDTLADGLPGAGFAGGGTYSGPQSDGLGGGAPGAMGGGGGGAPDNRSTYGQRGDDGMRTGQPGRDIQMTVDVPADVAARGGCVTLEYPRMRVTEDGRGLFRYDELHDLRVPPGVRHGQTLRVHHMGDDGTDGTYGDLVCELRVVGQPSAAPPGPGASRGRSPTSARAGASRGPSTRSAAAESSPEDATLDISVVEALLGGRVEVDTPTGRVRLTIPPGSSGGTRLRLRGRGANGTDHHVVVRIVVPKQLDDESRDLIEQFAALNPMDVRD
jgi:DnaJ-class molecular chaperone